MNELEHLKQQVAELLAWKAAKERQQLSFPVDDSSKAALGALIGRGNGSKTLTQMIDTSGANATVPAAYTDTLIVEFEGAQYEVPYL